MRWRRIPPIMIIDPRIITPHQYICCIILLVQFVRTCGGRVKVGHMTRWLAWGVRCVMYQILPCCSVSSRKCSNFSIILVTCCLQVLHHIVLFSHSVHSVSALLLYFGRRCKAVLSCATWSCKTVYKFTLLIFCATLKKTALVQWIRCSHKGSHLIHWTSAVFSHIALKWTPFAYILSYCKHRKHKS